MAEQIRKDVAVFIDFENVYVSVRDKLDANPNFEIIMDRCNELGRVILARAYADWYRYPRITSALYANNIEPMYVPTYYYDKDAGRTGRPIKNSVDMNLCIDAMRTLFTVPNISTFVLVTGDRDFIPLVNSIRQQGKDVIIIGVGGAASSHLAQSADEFIFYEQLIGKSLPTAVAPLSGRRVSDIDDFERPIERPPERITPRDRATARATANAKAVKPVEQPVAFNEDAAFELLVKAVLEARNRNMMTAFGSLKVLMKEMSGGEFREQQIKDGNGRPLERFKDFIHEAARRGKILISSDGVVNEVFLPGEDPRKLSQFTLASDASGERSSEEPPAPPPPTSSSSVQATALAATKFFDARTGRLDWPAGASSKRSVKAVSKVAPLAEQLERLADASMASGAGALVDLVARMLRYDPGQRLSAREALAHPFFREDAPPWPLPPAAAGDERPRPASAGGGGVGGGEAVAGGGAGGGGAAAGTTTAAEAAGAATAAPTEANAATATGGAVTDTAEATAEGGGGGGGKAGGGGGAPALAAAGARPRSENGST